jgi:hypothetical protein
VVFAIPPAADSRILISVNTVADYVVVGSQVQIIGVVNIGDEFEVTTWNDTAQQNILTLVFQGPVEAGITVVEPYDSTDYDLATVTDTPGSYDYSLGTTIANNNFDLQRADNVASRLWVTLDGYRLFEGVDYTVSGQYLILASGPIGAVQVLAVTEFTNSIVPEATGFRIFQDMRGVQATYRITTDTTTLLSQDLSTTDETIYVGSAAALSEPNLELGIFGVITIDGERIMYRERNVALNTVSGLRRGTAGTATASHVSGTEVYDLGRGNLLPEQYQDYVVSDTSIGDGSTTVFYAPSIDIDNTAQDSSSDILALEVYVGGIRQYAYDQTAAESQYRWFATDFAPVAIDFVVDNNAIPPLEAPASGVEVTILVRRGVTWYQSGVVYNPDTQTIEQQPSNGVALQDTNTVAARFIRGL